MNNDAAYELTSEPKARELSLLIVLLTVMLIVLAVVEVISLDFSKFWTDFGAGDDFLGVALVESIDKRLIFGIETTINR